MHRFIVVGGGAGGLELATRLGDRYGKVRKGGEPLSVNMEKFFKSGDTSQNVPLKQGDIVVVDAKEKKDSGHRRDVLGTIGALVPLFSILYYLRN